MNYQLEQALLDDDSRQFLFKLEDKIIKYLQDIQKGEIEKVEGIQYFNLKSFQKSLITKVLEYYKLSSKVVYIKVSTNTNKPNSEVSNPKQQNEQEGGDNPIKAKKKKKQGLLIFRSNENMNAPSPSLKLRDYFTSHQLQIHAEIVDSKKQYKKKKKFVKKISNESENDLCSSSIGKDEDCSLSSASSNTGIHSKDESQNSSRHKIEVFEDSTTPSDKSNNFLPSLAHILCISNKNNSKQQEEEFDLLNWINGLGEWKFTLRRQSSSFSYVVMESESDALLLEQIATQDVKNNNLAIQITSLTKIDKKIFREELKHEYLDQTIQKPKASVDVASRIIFGILGERKDIKNNSGDVMKRLVNKD